MSGKIHIGIAEDHDLVRTGFVRILGDYSAIQVDFEAANGRELLKGLKEFKSDMILLDIEMPVLSGIGAMEKVRQRFPKVKIIVISAHSEPSSIIEYVKLGANAFLPKNCKTEELRAAIYSVHEHGVYFDSATSKLLARNGVPLPGYLSSEKDHRELTEREITILKHICSNSPYKEIAHLMGLSSSTIDWYKHKLLLKTKAGDITGLVAYAKKHSYIA